MRNRPTNSRRSLEDHKRTFLHSANFAITLYFTTCYKQLYCILAPACPIEETRPASSITSQSEPEPRTTPPETPKERAEHRPAPPAPAPQRHQIGTLPLHDRDGQSTFAPILVTHAASDDAQPPRDRQSHRHDAPSLQQTPLIPRARSPDQCPDAQIGNGAPTPANRHAQASAPRRARQVHQRHSMFLSWAHTTTTHGSPRHPLTARRIIPIRAPLSR